MKDQVKKQPIGIDNDFLASISGLSIEDLKAFIVRLQIQAEENEAFKETLEFLKVQDEFDAAKESYNLVAGPIKETAKILKNRTKAVIECLKQKGGA